VDDEMVRQMYKLVLTEHPVCQEAGTLLRSFLLFIEQGFIKGLKSEARDNYIARLKDVIPKIGKD